MEEIMNPCPVVAAILDLKKYNIHFVRDHSMFTNNMVC
jgi:hypothetical protein